MGQEESFHVKELGNYYEILRYGTDKDDKPCNVSLT